MKITLLVISLHGIIQAMFPVTQGINCEREVAKHPAVVETYRGLYGNEVKIYCVEEQKEK